MVWRCVYHVNGYICTERFVIPIISLPGTLGASIRQQQLQREQDRRSIEQLTDMIRAHLIAPTPLVPALPVATGGPLSLGDCPMTEGDTGTGNSNVQGDELQLDVAMPATSTDELCATVAMETEVGQYLYVEHNQVDARPTLAMTTETSLVEGTVNVFIK